MTTIPPAPPGEIPHFEVTTLDGRRVRYRDMWQRRNLVLVAAGPAERTATGDYVSRLEAHRDELEQAETTLVATTDPVPGIAAPAVVIADRWGEIVHVESAGRAAELPNADEVLSWIRFVQIQCPECPP